MKKTNGLFSDRRRSLNLIKNAAILILIIITALMLVDVFHTQNIHRGNMAAVSGGTTVEEIFQNPSDIDDENISKAFWDYTSPAYIVVNKEGNRDILYSGTADYASMCEPAMNIIKGMYGEVTAQEVLPDTEIWKNMLSVNSILMHFPADIDPEFQMQFLGISQSAVTQNIETFSDVLIVTGMPNQENAVIYIKESKKEDIVKLETKLPIDELNRGINSLENINDKNYAFGYELKLDSYSGNSTMLSSMLTIPLVNIETTVISAKVPENFSQKLLEVGQSELSSNVLGIFGCDPDTVRSYIDSENSRILTGQNKRIALSSDGIIRFEADGAENGIDITGAAVQTEANSLYVAISGTVKTILGMFEITGTDIKNADYEIKLTEMSCSDDLQSEIRLSFDYYVNGLVMEYVDDPDSHAIEAVISGGRLVSFKMELKNFTKTEETVSNEQMITAIDKYCGSHQTSGGVLYIRDSYLYYGYTKNDEKMRTAWAVR